MSGLIDKAKILGAIVTAAVGGDVKELQRLVRLLDEDKPADKPDETGEPGEGHEEPDEEPGDEPVEGDESLEGDEPSEGEESGDEPGDAPDGDEEPGDEPDDKPSDEGEESGDETRPADIPEGGEERVEGDEEPGDGDEQEQDRKEDNPASRDGDRPTEGDEIDEEPEERESEDTPEDKPEPTTDKPEPTADEGNGQPCVTGKDGVVGCHAADIYPLQAEDIFRLDDLADEVRRNNSKIDDAVTMLAEDIASSWDRLSAPKSTKRIGAETGSLATGSMVRVATGHPLPFEGSVNSQEFPTLEVSVMIDRSGSMDYDELVTTSDGVLVFEGTRWQAACLTVAAMQEAVKLCGREDKITIRAFSWAEWEYVMSIPVVQDGPGRSWWSKVPLLNRSNGNLLKRSKGGWFVPHSGGGTLQGYTHHDKRGDWVVQVRPDGHNPKDPVVSIFEHHPASLVDCLIRSHSGLPWNGGNPIAPSLATIYEYLSSEDRVTVEPERKACLLFSDGDAGRSYEAGKGRVHLPPKGQLQTLLTTMEADGIMSGIVDYTGMLSRDQNISKDFAVSGDMIQLAELLGRLAE